MAFFEELANIDCGGVPAAIQVQTDMALPALANYGSDYLKKQFLAPSVSGDYVACVGVSEVSGGSDVAALKTYAKRDGDDLIINGSKMWITNGAQADWMCMLLNTREGHVHRNKSLVCVPMKSPGVTVARKISKLGLYSSDTAEIFFDNVRVPAKNIIGEEGEGFTYQMMQFQDERLCVGFGGKFFQFMNENILKYFHSIAVESMTRIIDETIEYCKMRHTFGMPLIENQHIYFRFAELKAEVELLRSLNYRAAGKSSCLAW